MGDGRMTSFCKHDSDISKPARITLQHFPKALVLLTAHSNPTTIIPMAPKATGRAVAAAPPDDELPVALLVPEAPVAELPVDVPIKLLYELPAALCSLARLLACAFNDVWSAPVAVAATEDIEAMTDDCEALTLEKTLEKFWPEGATMIPLLGPGDEIVEAPLRMEESGFVTVAELDVSAESGAVTDEVDVSVTTTEAVLNTEVSGSKGELMAVED
ncbi:hypothetical protein LTR17_014332 [Elasticomyces elasticus]|nr:hypothetical protein LTR17_014332 [Elasticomyces elasticus]